MPPKKVKVATDDSSTSAAAPATKRARKEKPMNPSEAPVVDAAGKHTIGVNTASKPPSRSNPNKPQYGWVLSEAAMATPEYRQRQAESAAKYASQLVLPSVRKMMMVDRLFTQLNDSPADRFMTLEQQSGIIRQALGWLRGAATMEEDVTTSTNPKTKDASTTIDYFTMFEKQIEANFLRAIPNTIAAPIFTKPTTPISDPAWTEEMLKEMDMQEFTLKFSLGDYLSKIEPKDKVQFTYGVKWGIIQKLESGAATRAEIVKMYGCKSEDVGRWLKERSTIKYYAEDPKTANAMRIR